VRRQGGGVGLFLLLQRATTLLVRDQHAAYYPSLYVDAHGEEDVSLRRGRPLMLSAKRYAMLDALYVSHRVGTEVARIRAADDRPIRVGHY